MSDHREISMLADAVQLLYTLTDKTFEELEGHNTDTIIIFSRLRMAALQQETLRWPAELWDYFDRTAEHSLRVRNLKDWYKQ